MRLTSRVRTAASPEQVWEVLGSPARWPEFEPWLRRVRGVPRPAAAGQALVGVSRFGAVAVPVDVLEATAGERLVLRVHTAPGVRQTLAFDLVPALPGGTDVRVCVHVEGLFARPAAVPLWLSSALTLRLLAVRSERLARTERAA